MSEHLDSRRLEEVTDFTSWEGVAHGLANIARCFADSAVWVQKNLERTERNLVLHNIMAAAPPYLGLAAREIQGPIQAMALCTRAIYELNLRARHLLLGGDSLEAWNGEFVRDNIEVLEGILTLSSDQATDHAATLNSEVKRYREVAERHQVNVKSRLLQPAELAAKVGRTAEHKALFKLFSKLVHPSAYLINKPPQEVHGGDLRNILALQLQLYAWDLLSRVSTALGAPSKFEMPSSTEGAP